ncbi:hypothetical protein K3495_g5964 [Podosphaera aphanis]|nr:hypothetical protein K3495_g5964 [Podosphaera aphanis]
MTKQVHLIPVNDLSSRNTAYQFYKECFRLHGLPDTIVSDLGAQFTSQFWEWLCKLLQIDHRLSTAFHPQIDGQTERINARLEQYLRTYVGFAQDDWDFYSTGVAPFLAVYGQYYRSGSELSAPLARPVVPASLQFQRRDAEELVENAQKIDKFLVDNISFHSAEYEFQANKSRNAARLFRVWDQVWLNLKNIELLHPCRKLDFKNGGPYEVVECIGKYAYKLKLPLTIKIHLVFHVFLLRPTANDPLPGQTSGPPPLVEADDNDPEYEIEKIIGSHWVDGSPHYLVRWRGYGPKADWSIPASQACGFKDLIQ